MQFPSGDHPWPTVAEKGTLRNVGGCRVEWKQGMIRNVRPDREIHHMSAPPFIRPSLPPLLRILEAITFSACFVSSSSSSLSLANYYRHKRVPFFFFFPQVFGTIVVIFSWFLFLDWTTRIIRWNLSYQSFKSDDTRLIQSTSRPTNLFRGATNTLLKGQRDYKPSNPGKSENPRPFERGPPCFLNINEPWNVVSSSLSFFSTWEKQIGRGVSSSRYSRPLALTVEWLSSVSSFKLGPLPPVHLTSPSPPPLPFSPFAALLYTAEFTVFLLLSSLPSAPQRVPCRDIFDYERPPPLFAADQHQRFEWALLMLLPPRLSAADHLQRRLDNMSLPTRFAGKVEIFIISVLLFPR